MKCVKLKNEALVDFGLELRNKPLMGNRTMLIAFGNYLPEKLDNHYAFKSLLAKISEHTKFKLVQMVTPQELDRFCCRFHGTMSQAFERTFDADGLGWIDH